MSVGLIALLDDIAALARLAATSLDDVAAQAGKAATKAAGVVIDDTAVTPRYMVGFPPERELPAIWRVTKGSLFNKLVILLPACLLLSWLLPGALTPLLVIGGLYLCYEGAEKVLEAVLPHAAQAHEQVVEDQPLDAKALEDERVTSAIRTDFILSAEIMTITLGSIPELSLPYQLTVLALVALAITFGVYGLVAIIIKIDDVGLALARRGHLSLTRALGRGLVRAMPVLLNALSIGGTVAMIWVGGGIILHAAESYGWHAPAHLTEAVSHALAGLMPAVASFASGLAGALVSFGFGLLVGLAAIPVAHVTVTPAMALWHRLRAK